MAKDPQPGYPGFSWPAFQFVHPPTPLTADEIRQIVREEIERGHHLPWVWTRLSDETRSLLGRAASAAFVSGVNYVDPTHVRDALGFHPEPDDATVGGSE